MQFIPFGAAFPSSNFWVEIGKDDRPCSCFVSSCWEYENSDVEFSAAIRTFGGDSLLSWCAWSLFSQVNMQCILWVKYILERTIDQHPKAFVYDLVKFRSQLGKWDAFVSGAFALNYFLNALQWTSQIDIHISAGDNYEGFLRYLQSTEKYYPCRSCHP